MSTDVLARHKRALEELDSKLLETLTAANREDQAIELELRSLPRSGARSELLRDRRTHIRGLCRELDRLHRQARRLIDRPY